MKRMKHKFALYGPISVEDDHETNNEKGYATRGEMLQHKHARENDDTAIQRYEDDSVPVVKKFAPTFASLAVYKKGIVRVHLSSRPEEDCADS
ncbi:hypothetical protein THAOC_21714 [Thalassiosira oceanica]|uniref:Uncharacterized protein n=1 Tax=Thalassiosira oceanica TaxID=159749 RepID=K0SBA9_THAOC|nr:hypothetical protein THAOC_21714 [Thalassiosira oceanica]|eukprot:EJK58181.1 hypothetical protein THAOC_21714 [Thalassiosira oceanica]